MKSFDTLECKCKFYEYLDYRVKEEYIMKNTAYGYKKLLEKFIDYLLSQKIHTISNVGEDEITRFLEQMKSKYTPGALRKYIFILQKFFEFIVNKNKLKKHQNPMLFFKLPKLIHSEPISLSSSEVKALVETAKKELVGIVDEYERLKENHRNIIQKKYSEEMIARIVKNYHRKEESFAKKYIKELRNYSMLALMLCFGCRRGELKYLKVKSLNFEEKTINFFNAPCVSIVVSRNNKYLW
jgi:site-specific recombinase XerD